MLTVPIGVIGGNESPLVKLLRQPDPQTMVDCIGVYLFAVLAA
jgi:hypothetical protein